MKLSVSNLAWPAGADEEAFALLAAAGVDGVEVAPTRIADWDALTPAVVADYRAKVEAAGLRISSLQALYFAIPDARLLSGGEAGFKVMLDHTRRISAIAGACGATALVFGAPAVRDPGSLSPTDAWALAVDRLRQIGDAVAAESDARFGLEPVPAAYGGAFLASAAEVTAMARAVDHPAVKVHLDTGCVLLGGDSIGDAILAAGEDLAHFHFAEPKLGAFSDPKADHRAAAIALNTIKYQHWCAIEILNASPWQSAVQDAVVVVRRHQDATA